MDGGQGSPARTMDGAGRGWGGPGGRCRGLAASPSDGTERPGRAHGGGGAAGASGASVS